METLLQQIINGLVLGSMYALVALGYTMVYGIINLINFAHGEVLMVGALTSWTIIGLMQDSMPGTPGWLILLVAMLINYQALWAAPIAFFFAALNIGSVQLQIIYKLDSSFAGVLQDILVLLVMLGEGARQRFFRKV